MAAPPPELNTAAPWKAIALALAVVCAALTGLLFVTISQQPAPPGKDDPAERDASADDAASAAASPKRGRIEGVVRLSGKAPVMQVPPRRKEAEFCRSQQVPSNAVLVNDGLLKDVLVRIEPGGAKGDYSPPEERVGVDLADCAYAPRIQGAMIGQELAISNRDPAFHRPRIVLGKESLTSIAQPRGAEAAVRMLDASGIYKLTCDVHPWERAFVAVSDHPFHAVTADDGAFAIPDVPVGRYMLEAWHARYGLRRVAVDVGDTPAVVKLTYDTTDQEPEINKGELGGAF